jgi:hypothetical protein
MKNYLFIFAFTAFFLFLAGCGNSNSNEITNAPVENNNATDNNIQSSQENQSEITNEVAFETAPSIDIKANPSKFLPESYFIYDRIGGDLNKDGLVDSVYVIKKIDPEYIVVNDFGETVDRNRRGIMVFFKHNNGWELVVENLTCFASENEDGGVYYPPQLTVVIKKGNLFIEYEHGRYGYWSYNFRLNNADFELIGFDATEHHGPTILSETSINYLTKRKLTKENINAYTEEGRNEIFEDIWTDIDIKNLLLISEIEDFSELGVY